MRESDEQGSTVDSCTYAEISCEESSFTEDMEGEMTQPRSQFTLPVRSARDALVPERLWLSASDVRVFPRSARRFVSWWMIWIGQARRCASPCAASHLRSPFLHTGRWWAT